MAKNSKSNDPHKLVWRYFGLPGMPYAPGIEPVGEVRYVASWLGEQVSRVHFVVTKNGEPAWELRGSRTGPLASVNITSDPEDTDKRSANNHINASNALLQALGWDSGLIKRTSVNLTVAGAFVIAWHDNTKSWHVFGTAHEKWDHIKEYALSGAKEAKKELGALASQYKLWMYQSNPHPVDGGYVDSPMLSALPVIEELCLLGQAAKARHGNRINSRGVLLVAEGDGGKLFNELTDASIGDGNPVDFTSGPIVAAVAPGTLEGESQPNVLRYVHPGEEHDVTYEQNLRAIVQRLATMMPVPSEVLLGFRAASKATAEVVDRTAYEAHVAPLAERIAQVCAELLRAVILLENADSRDVWDVVVDPSPIFAARELEDIALKAHNAGVISDEALRKALAFSEKDAPAVAEAEEPVTASAAPRKSEDAVQAANALWQDLIDTTVKASETADSGLFKKALAVYVGKWERAAGKSFPDVDSAVARFDRACIEGPISSSDAERVINGR